MTHLSSEEKYEALLSGMLNSPEVDSASINDILSNGFGSEIGEAENGDELLSGFDFSSIFTDAEKAAEEDDSSISHYENIRICLDIGNDDDAFEIPINNPEEKKTYTRRSVLNIKDAPADKSEIPIPDSVIVIKGASSNELIYEDEF